MAKHEDSSFYGVLLNSNHSGKLQSQRRLPNSNNWRVALALLENAGWYIQSAVKLKSEPKPHIH